MKRIFNAILIAGFSLGTFGFFFVSPVNAASSLYLAPASKSIKVDDTLAVQVRVNSDSTELRGVQANIAYPTGKLEYVSIDPTGSAFPLTFVGQENGGVVQIARTSQNPVSGDKLVATIVFKAKATGTAALSFAAESFPTKFSDSSQLDFPTSGASYSIAPKSDGGGGGDDGGDSGGGSTTGSSGSGSSSGGSSGGSSSGSTSTPDKDTKAPVISDITISNIDFKKATVNWKTNEKASSVVEYGPTKDLGFVEFSNSEVTSHKITLDKYLSAGFRVYYKIRSKDSEGNTASSKVTSFKMKGYAVKLRVTGNEGQALEDVSVTLVPGFDTAKTEKGGVVVFVDMSLGKYSVNVKVGEQTYASEIEVLEVENPEEAQEFDIKVAVAAVTQTNELLGIGSIVTLVILAGAAVVVVWLYRNQLLSARRVVVTSGENLLKKGSSNDDKDGSSGGGTSSNLSPPKSSGSTQDSTSSKAPAQKQEAKTSTASTSNESKPLMPRGEPNLDAVKWGKKK